jgi:hypothetical protein
MEQEPFETEQHVYIEEDVVYNLTIHSPYQKMEEHVVRVYWKIKDFIYETGEYDLLSYVTFDDIKSCLYNELYAKAVTSQEENPL